MYYLKKNPSKKSRFFLLSFTWTFRISGTFVFSQSLLKNIFNATLFSSSFLYLFRNITPVIHFFFVLISCCQLPRANYVYRRYTRVLLKGRGGGGGVHGRPSHNATERGWCWYYYPMKRSKATMTFPWNPFLAALCCTTLSTSLFNFFFLLPLTPFDVFLKASQPPGSLTSVNRALNNEKTCPVERKWLHRLGV